MDVAELLSNNAVVHTSFWLSWVCLALIAVLMFYTGEEASVRNTLLTLLMPVDILFGTGCAYLGSGTLDTEEARVICVVISVSAAAVIVLGVSWRSTTTVGLAAIGFEFAIISLKLFGGYTAQIMSAFIVLIAFMHGLKKYRDHQKRSREIPKGKRRYDDRGSGKTGNNRNKKSASFEESFEEPFGDVDEDYYEDGPDIYIEEAEWDERSRWE